MSNWAFLPGQGVVRSRDASPPPSAHARALSAVSTPSLRGRAHSPGLTLGGRWSGTAPVPIAGRPRSPSPSPGLRSNSQSHSLTGFVSASAPAHVQWGGPPAPAAAPVPALLPRDPLELQRLVRELSSRLTEKTKQVEQLNAEVAHLKYQLNASPPAARNVPVSRAAPLCVALGVEASARTDRVFLFARISFPLRLARGSTRQGTPPCRLAVNSLPWGTSVARSSLARRRACAHRARGAIRTCRSASILRRAEVPAESISRLCGIDRMAAYWKVGLAVDRPRSEVGGG